MKARLWVMSLAVAGVGGGCQSLMPWGDSQTSENAGSQAARTPLAKAAPAPAPVASVSVAAAATQPARIEAGAPSAEAMEAYARQMEALVARRAKAAASAGAPAAGAMETAPGPAAATVRAVPAGEASRVQWVDPGKLTLSPMASIAGEGNAAWAGGGAGLAEGVLAAARVTPLPGAVQVAPLPVAEVPATQPAAKAAEAQLAGRGPETQPAGDELERRLAQRLRDEPRDMGAQLDYQLLQLLKGGQTPQMASIAPLGKDDAEVLCILLDGLSNFRSAVQRDGGQPMVRKVRPLGEMAEQLRTRTDLCIPTAALCTRVDGYGAYEPMEPPRFMTGRENMAIIYCEVANFTSTHLGAKGMWETKLREDAVLYTENGAPVWQDVGKQIVDHCRNRRHDFFIVKMMRLPANLPTGKYLLKLTVVDQQANRVAETTMSVEIG